LKNAKPAPVNANVVFNLDEPDIELFNTFSEWLQGRITEAPEWKKKHGTANVPSKSINLDEDDPFSDSAPF
jgi:hypothetical protein